VSTVMAPGSRNRRAGELIGQGMPPESVADAVGETAEALDVVPLLARAARQARVEAPAVDGLDALLQGRIDAEEWVAALGHSSRRAA
jgi:glycerol-3-phosphate dehydrogenase (NAD(P)+)